jgi:hypothetical protein
VAVADTMVVGIIQWIFMFNLQLGFCVICEIVCWFMTVVFGMILLCGGEIMGRFCDAIEDLLAK